MSRNVLLPDPSTFSPAERRTLRLIDLYLRAVQFAVEWALPQGFKVGPTQVREDPARRRARVEKPWPMRLRASRDRIVVLSPLGRSEVLFNAGGRYDGFDHSLLAGHWRLNRYVRSQVRTIEDLGAALDSLQSARLIEAPRWEPYVGLLYLAPGVAEAVKTWDR